LAAVCRVTPYQVAARPGFAHGGIGRSPLPINPAQLITGLDQDGPEARQKAALAPLLEMAMDGAVIAKARRELISLAAGAQTEDDAIEHRAQIDAAMPLGLGGITLMENRLEQCPYVVRPFPDRWLLLLFAVCLAHGNPPFREGYRHGSWIIT
jgi:hypothetical protein